MASASSRAFPRFAVEADVVIGVAGGTLSGRTSNLSRGGLCVELDVAIAAGTDVDLAITLVFDDQGHSEPLALPARAMWSTRIDERHQIGFRFTMLRAREAAFLDMFLRYLEGARGRESSPPPPTGEGDDPFGG